MLILVVAASDVLAQQPLLSLVDYENHTATSALESELEIAERLAKSPNVPGATRRELEKYIVELKDALDAIVNSSSSVFPHRLSTIVNGTFTAGFPSVAALISNNQTTCSGTLVGHSSVLTARHCFPADPDPKKYQVHFQHANLTSIESITFPKDDTIDVALICLDDPVAGVAPVELATALTVQGTTSSCCRIRLHEPDKL